jgi:hypothetical protein
MASKNGSPEWKYFERLVKAIHHAADQGADVRWNEGINGRQFDVTIRFKKGLYEYLTVVECKKVDKPVSVEKVEAFVTKAGDVGADRAVMASTSGFQKGALDVAASHNMTLIHVTQSLEIDLSMFGAEWAGVAYQPHIQSIKLEYADGEVSLLPEESNKLTYYVKQIILQRGVERVNLETLLQLHGGMLFENATGSYKESKILCARGTQVIGPDDGEIPLKPIVGIIVCAGVREVKQIRASRRFDPCVLAPPIKVKDVASGQETIFEQSKLAVGFDTVFKPGAFYEHPAIPNFYYYCKDIEGETATLILVESFQLGILVQIEFRANTANQQFYILVTDQTVLKRLSLRLEAYRKAKRSQDVV